MCALLLLTWLYLLSRLSFVGLMRPVTNTRVLAVGESSAAVVSGWEEDEAVDEEKAGEMEEDADAALLMVEAVDAKNGAERYADLPDECLSGEVVRGGTYAVASNSYSCVGMPRSQVAGSAAGKRTETVDFVMGEVVRGC